MRWTAPRCFEGTGPTPGTYIRVKIGADQGRHVHRGRRPTWPSRRAPIPGSPVGAGCMSIFAPLRLQNVPHRRLRRGREQAEAHAYRAPGATQAAFAAETVVDEICREAGIDPLEFRLKNGAKEGDCAGRGPALRPDRQRWSASRRRMASPHYNAPLEARAGRKRRGRGVASGFWFNVGLHLERHGRQPGRHRQPARRLDRHRRHARLASRCSSPRRSASRYEDVRIQRRGHRLGRLQRRDRRQPRDLRHRLRGPRAGTGR